MPKCEKSLYGPFICRGRDFGYFVTAPAGLDGARDSRRVEADRSWCDFQQVGGLWLAMAVGV